MKFKTFLGWAFLLVITLAPIIPWYLFGNSGNLSNYDDFTHSVGQIAGLIGMTLFALTFIMSARFKFIENIFGGLDKVYIVHRVLGSSALLFILLHPIFLVIKYIPDNFTKAASYLLPFHALSVDFGILALLGMIFLILITFYFNIKYHKWKISHKFLGLIFIFAIFHIVLVRGTASRGNIFDGYYIYVAIVSILGLIGFLTITIKNLIRMKSNYLIKSVRKLNDVYEVVLSPISQNTSSKNIKFKAGQFFFLRFHSKQISSEPHPFSVATKSNDVNLKFIIKGLGDFTSKLAFLRIGDKVSVDGPYGNFNNNSRLDKNLDNKNNNQKDKIWIAGGIGITPYIGMAQDFNNLKPEFKVDLYYSARDEQELVYKDLFENIELENPKFKFIPWLTKKQGYLTVDEIIKISGNKLKKSEIYICGPQSLKDSITSKLLELGVSSNNIFLEDFNFK